MGKQVKRQVIKVTKDYISGGRLESKWADEAARFDWAVTSFQKLGKGKDKKKRRKDIDIRT